MDESLHLPNENLFVGDSTTAFLIDLTDSEGGSVNNCYSEVVMTFPLIFFTPLPFSIHFFVRIYLSQLLTLLVRQGPSEIGTS